MSSLFKQVHQWTKSIKIHVNVSSAVSFMFNVGKAPAVCVYQMTEKPQCCSMKLGITAFGSASIKCLIMREEAKTLHLIWKKRC